MIGIGDTDFRETVKPYLSISAEFGLLVLSISAKSLHAVGQ